jgi:SAM-dependent methyltransferase
VTDAADENVLFWVEYFEEVANSGPGWLDYSNAAVHAQTLALILESAGQIADRRCLDLGCGRGQLASIFKAMGASEVTGVDATQTLVQDHDDLPSLDIRWLCCDLSDPNTYESLVAADVVSLVEVAQYLPEEIFPHIWNVVAPGGRLVGTVPNAECPIVQTTAARFEGHFVPLTPTTLINRLEALHGLADCATRPMTFTLDQQISPYAVGQWTNSPSWRDPPNRIQFVALKSET